MGPTRLISRSILNTAIHALSTTHSASSLLHLRPLSAFRHLTPPPSPPTRFFSTRPMNDMYTNGSNRPPKETILLEGCDFEHWLVVVAKPEGDPTRDEIIDGYIKTLAKVVGSEEEARMKIYSVSTRHYFAFGALVSEELSYKLKELPGVHWVLPDSYLDVRNKNYGGEPFINGQAVPYDPKYHEEWVRNNARANERNRKNDRPRNIDRSRNFERRNMQPNQNSQNLGSNMAGGPQGNMGPNMAGGQHGNLRQNMAGVPQGNMGPNMVGGPPENMGHNMGGSLPVNAGQRNPGPNFAGNPPMGMSAPPYMGGMGHNMGGSPPGNVGQQNPGPNFAGRPPMGMSASPNMGVGAPPNNAAMPQQLHGMQSNNMGNPPNYNAGPSNMGGYPNNQHSFNYGNVPNDGMPNQNQNNFASNNGNPYQNMPGRDFQ